jgi:RimJ/RimL family protein N-acetyltransferase
MDIRRLTPDDAPLFSSLRLRALREEPMSFSSSPEEQAKADVESVGKRIAPSLDSFVLGAFESRGELIGIVGVYRQMPAKHAHKAFMWGMYVCPSHRGRGLGRQLVEAAIREAATLPGIEMLCTSVFLSAPAARALYPRCGFTSWGIQPRSAKIGGEYVAEEHFVLELPH